MGKKKREDKARKQAQKKKRKWLGGMVLLLLVGIFAWGWVSTRSPKRFSGSDLTASSGYVRRETRTPLSPALFVGKTSRAYQVAHEIPDILDQLYCYCECDKHMGHLSLLSCFVDSHGAT
jgi:hypothetical protein